MLDRSPACRRALVRIEAGIVRVRARSLLAGQGSRRAGRYVLRDARRHRLRIDWDSSPGDIDQPDNRNVLLAPCRTSPLKIAVDVTGQRHREALGTRRLRKRYVIRRRRRARAYPPCPVAEAVVIRDEVGVHQDRRPRVRARTSVLRPVSVPYRVSLRG